MEVHLYQVVSRDTSISQYESLSKITKMQAYKYIDVIHGFSYFVRYH